MTITLTDSSFSKTDTSPTPTRTSNITARILAALSLLINKKLNEHKKDCSLGTEEEVQLFKFNDVIFVAGNSGEFKNGGFVKNTLGETLCMGTINSTNPLVAANQENNDNLKKRQALKELNLDFEKDNVNENKQILDYLTNGYRDWECKSKTIEELLKENAANLSNNITGPGIIKHFYFVECSWKIHAEQKLLGLFFSFLEKGNLPIVPAAFFVGKKAPCLSCKGVFEEYITLYNQKNPNSAHLTCFIDTLTPRLAADLKTTTGPRNDHVHMDDNFKDKFKNHLDFLK